MVKPKGKRDAGVQKKKGRKSSTANMNSSRRLSRMGKEQKKGKSGVVTMYMSRTKAVKKLQITLRDFRRLCILKGIFPRVPEKKMPEGQGKTYYHIKDISFLQHEPLLVKFREFKSFMKKLRRQAGRQDIEAARKIDDKTPQLRLDHLVRERYPSFLDALRDLDDALCMVHLFVALPNDRGVKKDSTQMSLRLTREWQAYVTRTHALRKVFVSVKGIYYQAEIQGQPITWLVPHKFTQHMPRDVDYRIMMTFMSFFEVLLKFVHFKLYHQLGMRYPPAIDAASDARGGHLEALKLVQAGDVAGGSSAAGDDAGDAAAAGGAAGMIVDGAEEEEQEEQEEEEEKAVKLGKKFLKTLPTAKDEDEEEEEEEDEDEDEDEDGKNGDGAKAMEDVGGGGGGGKAAGGKAAGGAYADPALDGLDDAEEAFKDDAQLQELAAAERRRTVFATLFKGLRFLVGREAPKESLEFVITSFGGEFFSAGAGAKGPANASTITHEIVDRPALLGARVPSREYVQPQWVFDSINARMLLPTSRYAVGAKLPPHLSPFVDNEREGYTPAYSKEIAEQQEAAGVAGDAVRSRRRGGAGEGVDDDEEGSDDGEESEDDEEVAEEERAAEERRYAAELEKEKGGRAAADDDDDDDDDDGKEEEEDDEDDEEEEEEEEEEGDEEEEDARASAAARKAAKKREREELAKIMMGKKAKRLHDRMQHGIAQKQSKAVTLEKKRKELAAKEDGGDEADGGGKAKKGGGKKSGKKRRTR